MLLGHKLRELKLEFDESAPQRARDEIEVFLKFFAQTGRDSLYFAPTDAHPAWVANIIANRFEEISWLQRNSIKVELVKNQHGHVGLELSWKRGES